MKTPLAFLFLIIVLGSCEEIIYEEIVQKVTDTIQLPGKTDTVFLEKVFWRTDTIELRTVTTQTDTFFIATIDSVFIYTTVLDTVFLPGETVYVYDTILVHHYNQVEYIFPFNSVTYVPIELQPIVEQFFADAMAYNKTTVGGDMLIQFVSPELLTGEGWTSDSWQMSGWQWVISISDQLTIDASYSSIYRELARMQLGKQYTTGDNIMNPLFDPAKIKMSSTDAQKKIYLDKLFAE